MKTLEKIRTGLMNVVVEAGKIIAFPFYKNGHWKYPHEVLCNMPAESVGKELGDYLNKVNFELAKGYEPHDVKHIITGYEMDTLGEIRMQFYLCGNGNKTLPALFTMAFGVFLIPEHLFTFLNDMDEGRKARSLFHLDYESVMPDSLKSIRLALNIQHLPFEAKSVFTLLREYRRSIQVPTLSRAD